MKSGRSISECQANLANALQAFGHINVLLCCNTEGQRDVLGPLQIVDIVLYSFIWDRRRAVAVGAYSDTRAGPICDEFLRTHQHDKSRATFYAGK